METVLEASMEVDVEINTEVTNRYKSLVNVQSVST